MRPISGVTNSDARSLAPPWPATGVRAPSTATTLVTIGQVVASGRGIIRIRPEISDPGNPAVIIEIKEAQPGLRTGLTRKPDQAHRLTIPAHDPLDRQVPVEVPRAFRTVHPLGWATWKGEFLAPTEEELLTGIQGRGREDGDRDVASDRQSSEGARDQRRYPR